MTKTKAPIAGYRLTIFTSSMRDFYRYFFTEKEAEKKAAEITKSGINKKNLRGFDYNFRIRPNGIVGHSIEPITIEHFINWIGSWGINYKGG